MLEAGRSASGLFRVYLSGSSRNRVGELEGWEGGDLGQDRLPRGLNENVVMGRLIPAGQKGLQPPGEDPRGVIEHPELEQLDSEYSPEYLVEPNFTRSPS